MLLKPVIGDGLENIHGRQDPLDIAALSDDDPMDMAVRHQLADALK